MPFGVDEAGKGPVLGSMFAAAVVADPDALPGAIADSKTLPAERRDTFATQLRGDSGVSIGLAEIPVSEIDDPETDMNELTVAAQANALEAVEIAGETGYVDAGDVDADRFGRRVNARVEADLTIHAEHGADERYPLVSAASIIAKVTRDAHVERLDAEYDAPIGSGYPSDERTRHFLRNYVEKTSELPACARRSWQTSRDILAEAAQSGLEEF
ncbi:ribonuclease HII [Halodesulfurarchaeum sp.]|uniref:ribonuclease HII n=1 Tax=Halodesulfurarchaeum sp. TaxID=1980530 RepID=UPI002FC37131